MSYRRIPKTGSISSCHAPLRTRSYHFLREGIYNSYRKGCKISGKIRRKNIRDLYALDSNSIVKFNNRIDILSKVSTFLMKIDNEYFTDFIYKGLFFIRNNFSELYYHIRNKWIHKVTV